MCNLRLCLQVPEQDAIQFFTIFTTAQEHLLLEQGLPPPPQMLCQDALPLFRPPAAAASVRAEGQEVSCGCGLGMM